MSLGRQLYVQYVPHQPEKPIPALVTPIRNDPTLGIRPLGGIMTSTYRPETKDSEQVEWCEREFGGLEGKPRWLLSPYFDMRVYTIDTLADLVALIRQYPRNDALGKIIPMIDFEAMHKDYDALHVTSAGQVATRLSSPGLHGWDFEATYWFTWAFVEVEDMTWTI